MKHLLPSLPYAIAALEPHVDARTMQLHHGNHHATYVANLNAALEKHPQLQDRSASWLLLNPGRIPEAIRADVAHNAGGHLNHSLYWKAMSPGGGVPTGALAEAIVTEFGSVDRFKTHFAEAGAKLFGSGWVWLVRGDGSGGRLRVLTTNGHENPMALGHFPILLNDVWEHAYYLKHQNRRPEFLAAWWAVTDWQEAAIRFEESGRNAGHGWMHDSSELEANNPARRIA